MRTGRCSPCLARLGQARVPSGSWSSRPVPHTSHRCFVLCRVHAPGCVASPLQARRLASTLALLALTVSGRTCEDSLVGRRNLSGLRQSCSRSSSTILLRSYVRATPFRFGTPRCFVSRRCPSVSRFAPPVCLLCPSAVSQHRRLLRAQAVARSRSRQAAATRPDPVPPSWFLTTAAVCSDDALPGCCTRLRPWGSRRVWFALASRRALSSLPPRLRPSEGLLP